MAPSALNPERRSYKCPNTRRASLATPSPRAGTPAPQCGTGVLARQIAENGVQMSKLQEGVACDALVIEASMAPCWALAKLGEPETPFQGVRKRRPSCSLPSRNKKNARRAGNSGQPLYGRDGLRAVPFFPITRIQIKSDGTEAAPSKATAPFLGGQLGDLPLPQRPAGQVHLHHSRIRRCLLRLYLRLSLRGSKCRITHTIVSGLQMARETPLKALV